MKLKLRAQLNTVSGTELDRALAGQSPAFLTSAHQPPEPKGAHQLMAARVGPHKHSETIRGQCKAGCNEVLNGVVQTASAGGIWKKRHLLQGFQRFELGRQGGRFGWAGGFRGGRWQPGQSHKMRARELTLTETYYVPGSELNLSTCLFHANTHPPTHTRGTDVGFRDVRVLWSYQRGSVSPSP